MINYIVHAIWFFLPAGIANATPVFASKLPLLKHWNTPLDLGRTYRGKRLLGNNKTWRGLVGGSVAGGLTSMLQFIVTDNQVSLGAFLLGAIMGFGALTGDAVESFFKRRRGVASGKSWFPFDQIDYIIGGLVFIYPFTHLPLRVIALVFIVFFGLHLLTAYIGYLLGLKDEPI